MQISWSNTMALTLKNISGFIFFYKGKKFIGNIGCKFLSEANWPCLKYLILSSNNIGSEGIKYLCKSDWSNVK